MFPSPNFIWKCEQCGEEQLGHRDDESPQLTARPLICPKCGHQMKGRPITSGGPEFEHPYKVY